MCRAVLALEETEASAKPPVSAQPEVIGRFQIEKRLGAGAMGVVYSAYDAELDRRIAVKLMRPQASPDRLRREAQTLAKLSHPNIVTVHDVGVHRGAAFVAMALVDGENLRSWLATPRPPEEILDKLVQAMRGIIAAHAEGVIHRDLKPDNIFVSRRGDVLVGDFGLARSSSPPSGEMRADELTQTGTIMGTPVYMAPEAFAGETTAASDQFSLAVTMWEAFYGTRPFRGNSIDELLKAIDGGPDDPPKHVPWHDAILRGLAKDPRDRFPSIAAMLAAITRRRKKWPYLAAALALLAAGGTAFAVTRPDPKQVAIATCSREQDRMLAWNPVRRAIVLAELTGRFPTRGGELAALADCYATQWIDTSHESCKANAEQRLSNPEHAAMKLCLGRQARMFDTVLMQMPIANAPLDVRNFLDTVNHPESCRGVTVETAPTPEILAVQAEIDSRHIFAIAEAASTVQELASLEQRADHTADLQTRADAQAVIGDTLVRQSRYREAEPHLRSAVALADQARDDRMRAEAGAQLAILLVQTGRVAEATVVRDNAASAAARTNDAHAKLMVGRANVALIQHESSDPRRTAAEYRAMISLGQGTCGSTIDAEQAEVQLALAEEVTGEPGATAHLARARATMERWLETTQDDGYNLLVAAMTEPDRRRRIALVEQALPLLPKQSTYVANTLGPLGQDYEYETDYLMAYRTYVRRLDALDHEDVLRPTEILPGLIDIATTALDAADTVDDPKLRDELFAAAIAAMDRRDKEPGGTDETSFYRGRVLYRQGHIREAIPLLRRGLAVTEASQPAIPGRVALRATMLAHALFDLGEREQAKLIADVAHEYWPKGIELVRPAAPKLGAAFTKMEQRAADFDAWYTSHF